ncbi:ornithine carbamoyltransferase [Arhodomonas sp. AD133]|uniref:ornithine carbamoyltransferase n=1 Tax=Arhodomonas sp. AD133 TaxID=3415009 RepID=UPI003EBEE30C
MQPRHFLTLDDCTPEEILTLIRRATELKHLRERGEDHEPLHGKVLGMIFEKSSTRTRVSFEAGMAQLGGSSLFLSPRDTQLGRGEPVEDTARVISSMLDVIMVRTAGHDVVERFANHSRVPVINGLTDDAHPCQLLADLQTFTEHRGDIAGRTVAWLGDSNNMCRSYIRAAHLLDFKLRIGCPGEYAPKPELVDGERIVFTTDPAAAVDGADVVVTDVWASMGFESEEKERMAAFQPYQVNAELMQHAADDAIFMHCLPAHRGEEVTTDVLEGPQSVVWDEAENRLHAQKALLEFLLLTP